MIKLQKKSEELVGEVNLPLSKSISNRVIIIKALSSLVSHTDVADCEDSRVLFEAVEFGADKINVGNAGTPYRFLLAYLSYVGIPVKLEGSKRMCERPIAELVDALTELGARIEYLGQKGFPPVHIVSGIKDGKQITIDQSRSSQFASALLLVAPYLKSGIELQLKGESVSRPYLDMSIKLMELFGAKVHQEGSVIRVEHSNYIERDYKVERDWSSASYFFTLLSLSDKREVLLKELSLDSLQGDSRCAKLYEAFGIQTEQAEQGLRISKKEHKTGFELDLDMADTPDLVPSIIVSMIAVPAVHRIRGIKHLKIKESDRIQVLAEHLEKLNVSISEEAGNVTIDTRDFNGIDNFVINSTDDHRMAMALSCLTQYVSSSSVPESDVVKKSFPGFWNELSKFMSVTNA